jgi:hypothetical protein
MADRRFTQFGYTLERQIVKLYADVVTDGAGTAISSSTTKGFTVTRTGVGAYTLTFSHTVGTATKADKYNSLKMVQMVENTGGVAKVQIVADNIGTTGIVTVLLLDFAGAAVDPATSTQHWEVTLKNTSVSL